MCAATVLFIRLALRPILLLILQADPVDENSIAYQAGRYFAYAFILIVVVALVVYAVRKGSGRK
jgi:uncharacterized membrane protein